jgi:hypothetical protein
MAMPQYGAPFSYFCSVIQMVMDTKRVCLFNEVSSLCDAYIKAEVDEIIWQMTHESQLIPMIMKDLNICMRSPSLQSGVSIRFRSIGEREWIASSMR